MNVLNEYKLKFNYLSTDNRDMLIEQFLDYNVEEYDESSGKWCDATEIKRNSILRTKQPKKEYKKLSWDSTIDEINEQAKLLGCTGVTVDYHYVSNALYTSTYSITDCTGRQMLFYSIVDLTRFINAKIEPELT